jgi:hypothetical protein
MEFNLNLFQSIMPVINHHLIAERSHEVDDDAVGPAEPRLDVVFPAAARSAR